MSTVNNIPLIPAPQTFNITLGTVVYKLTVKWNVPAQAWVLDISTPSGTPILSGVPLITGADLLEQYEYLNFGGALYAQTDNAPDAVPTYTNLGSDGHLYFVVP